MGCGKKYTTLARLLLEKFDSEIVEEVDRILCEERIEREMYMSDVLGVLLILATVEERAEILGTISEKQVSKRYLLLQRKVEDTLREILESDWDRLIRLHALYKRLEPWDVRQIAVRNSIDILTCERIAERLLQGKVK